MKYLNKNKVINLKSQAGASLGGIIFNVAILMVIGFSGAKVASFYLDNNTIKSSLEDLGDVPYITKKSKREVTELLRKRIQFESIEVSPSEIFVDKRSDKVVIDVNYERRVHMFANIDVVVRFENNYIATSR